MSEKKQVGFIGLGTMGFSVASNLHEAGFEVVAFDVIKETRNEGEEQGFTIVESPKAVADTIEDGIIISLVGTVDQNREIVFGMEGLSALEKNQAILFVMSTLDPNAIKDLADDIKAETNMTVISAPVSGGASGAKDETLSVMTSGDKDAIDRFMPQLEAISANVFYFGGDVSQSQAAKLSNNLILGIVMNGVAEAFRLADYYDLPEDEVLSLFEVSTGDSWVVQNWHNVKERTSETALEAIVKDMTAVFNLGIENNIKLPFNALGVNLLYDSMEEERKQK